MTKPHRQQYGLGSFVKKAFKKVTKPIKKIAKSPIGKLALLGGGLYGLGGMQALGGKGIFASGQGLQRFRNLANIGSALRTGAFGNVGGPANRYGKPGWFSGARKGLDKFGWGKAALLGGGALATALPFMGGDEEEDIVEEAWDVTPSSIANIRNMARNRDPSLAFMPQSQYVQSGYYLKDGGIAGLANGGNPAQAQAEQMLRMEYQKYRNQGGTMSYQQFKMAVLQQAQGQGPMAQGQAPMAQPQMAAHGGRMGYQAGEMVTDESMMAATPTGMMEENIEQVTGEPTREQLEALAMEIYQLRLEELDQEQLAVVYQLAMEAEPQETMMQAEDIQMAPQGAAPVMAAEGGLMSLGGMEKDYRAEGGFVPIGKEERADDVPARLSKNEFVFTADAVRNAGGGDIDKGAQVMENMMNNLEAGGQISEESQGEGAQRMYDTMTELETRVA